MSRACGQSGKKQCQSPCPQVKQGARRRLTSEMGELRFVKVKMRKVGKEVLFLFPPTGKGGFRPKVGHMVCQISFA